MNQQGGFRKEDVGRRVAVEWFKPNGTIVSIVSVGDKVRAPLARVELDDGRRITVGSLGTTFLEEE